MRILFLGSGSAHTVGTDNFQSNMLLVAGNGRCLLIDCGSDIRWSLARQGFSHRDITDIYVSHLHADHIGGLEYVGFKTRFDPACRRPRLYLEASLAGPLWDHSLRGGMGVITDGETRLEDFFEVVPLRAHEPFEWEGARLEMVPVAHVVAPRATMHSNGLLIGAGDQRVLLTTDTRFDAELLAPYYASADLIFQDCETSSYKTGIHAHYSELRGLAAAVRAKMWLYDYPPGPLPDAVADGFRGFVRPGQSFELPDGGGRGILRTERPVGRAPGRAAAS
jgi:ribonuclease BN (tRNA processing enzyme)